MGTRRMTVPSTRHRNVTSNEERNTDDDDSDVDIITVDSDVSSLVIVGVWI